MKITTDFGGSYEAKELYVEMVKTLVVKVYLDASLLPSDEVSEEELEQIAHENWLEAYAQILEMVGKGFPDIDVEGISTDYIKVEMME